MNAWKWMARHPVAAAEEVQIVLRHAPQVLRGKRLKSAHDDSETQTLIDASLTEAKQEGRIPYSWKVLQAFETHSNVAVLLIGEDAEFQSAFLKIGLSDEANATLQAHARTISSLHQNPVLSDWLRLVPVSIGTGEVTGRRYFLERRLPGRDLAGLDEGPVWIRAYENAISAIDELHRATGDLQVVDADLLSRWFEPALESLTALYVSRGKGLGSIARLRRRLTEGLEGRSVWVSHIHGDYHPGNVLVDDESGLVTGILDWDRSASGRPAFLDVGYQALSAHLSITGERFGTSVCDIANGFGPATPGLALINKPWAAFEGDRINRTAIVLAVWLEHVGHNLTSSQRYRSHPMWIHRTVDAVLDNLNTRTGWR